MILPHGGGCNRNSLAVGPTRRTVSSPLRTDGAPCSGGASRRALRAPLAKQCSSGGHVSSFRFACSRLPPVWNLKPISLCAPQRRHVTFTYALNSANTPLCAAAHDSRHHHQQHAALPDAHPAPAVQHSPLQHQEAHTAHRPVQQHCQQQQHSHHQPHHQSRLLHAVPAPQ